MFKQTLTALLFAATLYAPHVFAADTPPFEVTTIMNGNEFAANTVWYTFQLGSEGFYLDDAQGGSFIPVSRLRVSNVSDKYLWCFVGNNTEGYRIYNKAAGVSKVLAAPSVTGNGGESFAVLKNASQLEGYSDRWIFSSSDKLPGKTAFFLNVKGNDSWKLNNRSGKLAFWTGGADNGSSFVVTPMKDRAEVLVTPSTGTLTSLGNSGYKALWTSKGSIPVTLNAGNNNMNVASDILQLHSGGSRRCTYIFSAPAGYAVKSVEFDLQLANAGKKVSARVNGKETKLTTTEQHFAMAGDGKANTLSFDLEGENTPVKALNMKVVVEAVKPDAHPQKNVFEPSATSAEGYRIPAITVTNTGDIVAFSDARYTPNASDIGHGRVDLVVSRSTDNGKTWSTPEVMKGADGNPVAKGDGKMVEGDPNKSRTAGYGDAAVVADRESNDLLVMSVSGYTVFFDARREKPNAVARWISHDGGKTFSQHEDLTDQIYQQFDNTAPRGKVESLFFGSGRITQSRYTKVQGSKYYRLYAVLLGRNVDPVNHANWVMYSDDFGANWKVLGGAKVPAIPSGADEPKCEELPDGSVVVSSRKGGGRWFNIFRFTNAAAGQGYWEEMAESSLSRVSNDGCNGELLIVPVVKKATNQKMYLALQSVPFGPRYRTNVGINYKELANADDFSSPANFAKEWDGAFMVSPYPSAYSVMAWQKDDKLAFMYEEESEVKHPGYTQVYKNFTIEQITNDVYAYAPEDETVANELTKGVLDARLAEAKQRVGDGIGQYAQETADMFDQVVEMYRQHPSKEVYEAFNTALKEAPVKEVTDKEFFYLQNDGYKAGENKSYYLQFDENQNPKGVDAYDKADEKQYFVFYNVAKKPGHYYIYNKSWDRFLLPLQQPNQAVLSTDKKEEAGEYVLEHLGNGESLLRCVNGKDPVYFYLHLAGYKKLVCWQGKESAPSHWRILPVGLETNMTTAVKSAAKSATPVQYYDLSGRKVSPDHKGLKVSKEGKAF